MSNDIPINVTAGHPLFALNNGQAPGTVFSGMPAASTTSPAPTASTCSSTPAFDDALRRLGRGDDAILYTIGDGVDTIDGGTGTDTLFVR